MHRLKGLVTLDDGSIKVIQGVRDVFEIIDSPKSASEDDPSTSARDGKLVIIGRGLKLGEDDIKVATSRWSKSVQGMFE